MIHGRDSASGLFSVLGRCGAQQVLNTGVSNEAAAHIVMSFETLQLTMPTTHLLK